MKSNLLSVTVPFVVLVSGLLGSGAAYAQSAGCTVRVDIPGEHRDCATRYLTAPLFTTVQWRVRINQTANARVHYELVVKNSNDYQFLYKSYALAGRYINYTPTGAFTMFFPTRVRAVAYADNNYYGSGSVYASICMRSMLPTPECSSQ